MYKRQDFAPLVAIAHERFPAMRIVADRELPGVTAVATSEAEIRGLILRLPGTGGPVGPNGRG